MNTEIAINLIYNITTLLTMAFIYSLFQNKNRIDNRYYKVLLGVFIGAAGILIMMTALRFEDGIIFDARSILISVSGMFFGAVPTIIAAFIMIVFRIILGGAGTVMGILVILTTSFIGILWHRYRFHGILKHNKYAVEFYLFGLIIHIDMIVCMFVLPWDMVMKTIQNLFIPVIVLYPIGTYLLCRLFLNQFERNNLFRQLSESEEKYRQIAENTSDLIWTVDMNLNLTYVSPSSERLFGVKHSSYLKTTLEERFPPEEVTKLKSVLIEELEKDWDPASDKGRSRIIEAKHYRGDGSIAWVSMNVSTIRDEDGNIVALNGITRDITELKKVELEKAKQTALIVSLIDAIPDLIFFKDTEGVYLGCNSAFSEFVGKPKEDIIGKNDYELFPADTADIFRYHDNIMLKNRKKRRNEEWGRYPDGREVLLDTLKTPYLDADGSLIGILGISRDISERKRKEDEISYIAYHDYLTGLYNRRFYEEELRRLDVSENLPLTMIMGDVNGLKLINDSFGHLVGDELLKKVAEIIKASCRADDIIARFGGDEFVILLPETGAAEADKIIERIHELSAKEKINGIEISISFGHETKVNPSENIADIIKNAENSMYRDKLFESASMRSKTIDLIMNTLYEKNNREMMHSKRVSKLCEEMALHMHLGRTAVEQIKLAGLVHDIGKIGIEEIILNSPNKLSGDEWHEMKKHSEIGYRILSSAAEFTEIAEYVLQHQEKWDGSGYPKGLKGREIAFEARLIAIADAYDAMTGVRTYGRVFTREEALEELVKCSGTHFDPDMAAIFVDFISKQIKDND
ncbi:diguanylate cyclase [Dehalobacter sp. DCM]|uniref:diguanylate cyclase n=1 Tax=Dehalobacter sp. DCM TaxID=2907827 RepID=UPI003081CCCE|nr:diguanylate cyclase [Dehalobacter sp. DCM]